MPDLYIGRTMDVKAKCTPRDVYGENSLVHDVYMAGTARKKAAKHAKPTFEPCRLLAWRKHRGLSQHELSDQIGAYLKVHGLEVGHSYSMLGRIERGLEPYNQVILQAAAQVLKTSVKSLLFVDPSEEKLVEMADELVRHVRRR